MASYAILSEKPWNAGLAGNLSRRLGGDGHRQSELSSHALEAIGPAAWRGSTIGCEFAEAFMLLRSIS